MDIKYLGHSSFRLRGKNTIYLIEIDGVTILHCGDLGHQLSDDLLDKLDEVNILLVPTGGHFTINEKEALTLIRKIEPSIVIPMHYKVPGMGKGFDALSTLDSFLKEVGKVPQAQNKLTITYDKLP